jgi:hypothetical protein
MVMIVITIIICISASNAFNNEFITMFRYVTALQTSPIVTYSEWESSWTLSLVVILLVLNAGQFSGIIHNNY